MYSEIEGLATSLKELLRNLARELDQLLTEKKLRVDMKELKQIYRRELLKTSPIEIIDIYPTTKIPSTY